MGWRREKRISYRDQTGRTQQEHVEHWEGFEWEGGPVIVQLKGNHGTIQVWAISEAEGRRVIEHACSIAGIDPAAGNCWWEVAESSSSRNGKPARYRTKEKDGYVYVSKRDGPNGSPWWTAAETW